MMEPKHKSLWEATDDAGQFRMPGGEKTDDRQGRARELHTDVLVIGGGLCGILTAYRLRQNGVACMVAEAEYPGFGTTGRTTAKVTAQHGAKFQKLIDTVGLDAAGQYLRINQAAVEEYAALCRDIDCDFEEKDAYLFALQEQEYQALETEQRALERLRFRSDFVQDVGLPFFKAAGIRFEKQAQLHPLKLLHALCRELEILPFTRVRDIKDGAAISENTIIHAKLFVVATHFPFIDRHGFYFLKMYQQRSYVIAAKSEYPLDGMYLAARPNGISLRRYGDYLLVGGGGHRTGKKGEGWRAPEIFLKRLPIPAKPCYYWAAQDCMTLDTMPYIGPYAKSTPDILVATGFEKWGMTGSMAASMLLCDRVMGKDNEYSETFSPSRRILHPGLAVNAGEAVLHLLAPVGHRCTHMGCALHWNRQEHSWDCPCHGSRYTPTGNILDGPTTKKRKHDEK